MITKPQAEYIDKNKLEKSPKQIAKFLKIEVETVLGYIEGKLKPKEDKQTIAKINISDRLMIKNTQRGATVMTGGMSGHADETKVKGKKANMDHIFKPKG